MVDSGSLHSQAGLSPSLPTSAAPTLCHSTCRSSIVAEAPAGFGARLWPFDMGGGIPVECRK